MESVAVILESLVEQTVLMPMVVMVLSILGFLLYICVYEWIAGSF